ncbi:MAG: MOSC domain-containing protein [Thermoplasmatota archaeon]
MSGRVVALGTAETAGAPIVEREAVTLVAGRGIEGDRYALGLGKWQDSDDIEITFVESEVAEEVGIAPLATRRNIVTAGVKLDALIGKRFRVGEALIEGVRPCEPCGYMSKLNGRPSLKDEMAKRGGLRARIVRGGQVHVGDAVEAV